MSSPFLARVRWSNVAVALLATALLGVVVAWPLLAPAAPALPPEAATPVRTAQAASPTATPAAVPTEEPGRIEWPKAKRPAKAKTKAAGKRRRPAKPKPEPRRAKAPPTPKAVAPVAPPPPTPVYHPYLPTDPEFGFGFEQ